MNSSSSSFWSRTVVSPLLSLMEAGDYSTEARNRAEDVLKKHVLPHLGPQPAEYSTDAPPFSFMCDDGSPIEFSLVVDRCGATVVRFAIEPVETVAGGGVPATDPRALIEGMVADGSVFNVDMGWFDICKETLTIDSDWHALASQHKVEHKSQYFIGYDIGRCGRPSLKAYFIPRLLSAATGKSTQSLIGEACDQLGLSKPWKALIDFAAERSIAPEFAITAIDLLPASKNRLKVYVRASRSEMSFRALRSYFTLNGRLQSGAIDDALAQLWELWTRLFPCEDSNMSREEQEARRIPALHNGDASTAALCMYYDLRQGAVLPAPKVYIPVRHYCESDAIISRTLSQFYLSSGNKKGFDIFGKDSQSAFKHLPPASPFGRHTYISCAIKRGDHEFSAYYSSMAFSQAESFP